MPKVLLTGFEPFGGETINPSYEAVKQLDGENIEGYAVASIKLPTVFRKSIEALCDAMDRIQPDIVICVGQAGGRNTFSVERVAINIDDARIPDTDDQQPVDKAIISDGPVAYWSTLPIKAIVEDVQKNGIPASVSQTAGTYVCNHIFYGLMHYIESNQDVRGGFIHIPYLPEQAVNHLDKPSMHLDDIKKAIRIAVSSTINNKNDIVRVGGQTH